MATRECRRPYSARLQLEDKMTTTTTTTDPNANQRVFSFKLTQLVWLAFGSLEALIALRVVLKLIGANPASPFAVLIYAFTDIFLWPFAGLTRTPGAAGMVLEISSLIAMVVYALAAWIIAKVVWVALYRPRETMVIQDTVTSPTTRIKRS
jgi:hypothetical protein